jgi:hypothetical protein
MMNQAARSTAEENHEEKPTQRNFPCQIQSEKNSNLWTAKKKLHQNFFKFPYLKKKTREKTKIYQKWCQNDAANTTPNFFLSIFTK